MVVDRIDQLCSTNHIATRRAALLSSLSHLGTRRHADVFLLSSDERSPDGMNGCVCTARVERLRGPHGEGQKENRSEVREGEKHLSWPHVRCQCESENGE